MLTAPLALLLLLLTAPDAAPAPPFKTIAAKAYHILPETHNNESGYFSLCAGLNGRIYVGTAKYGVNAYLVEFDPTTEKQRIVIDTHKLCGLNATGYAAQAKIHTRNFVGPSGTIYVGSKQGYPTEADKKANVQYPGGYVMTYDPVADKAKNLGMPFPTEGVIDTVADESRGLIYVVTCETQHWMVYDIKAATYTELGPLLTPYAATVVDASGRAAAITADFRLAQYDPATKKVQVRDILVDGVKWTRAGGHSIPAWILAPDAKSVYVILLNDPTLIRIDLTGEGETVKAAALGKLTSQPGPDSRSGLTWGPDGNLYTLYRVENDTGYGHEQVKYLHQLSRYSPATGAIENAGILTVSNDDWFDFSPLPDGKPRPFSNGFPRLPNGVRAPLHVHMGLIATPDGTLWATMLSPYTLLKIEGVAKGTSCCPRSMRGDS